MFLFWVKRTFSPLLTFSLNLSLNPVKSDLNSLENRLWNVENYFFFLFRIMGIPKLGLNAGPTKVIKAARVLRPLKLVSNVPSKVYHSWIFIDINHIQEVSFYYKQHENYILSNKNVKCPPPLAMAVLHFCRLWSETLHNCMLYVFIFW